MPNPIKQSKSNQSHFKQRLRQQTQASGVPEKIENAAVLEQAAKLAASILRTSNQSPQAQAQR